MAIDLARARADTPGCAHRNHLNHAGASLMPQPVLDAVVGHLRREAEIGGYEAKDEAAEPIDAVRADVAKLIGARPHEIALLENATRAWESVFYSLPLEAGDRILTSVAEYGSNALAYLHVARRTGAEVVVVPDDEHGQLDVGALRDAIDDRTRLIGVSHIPTDGGLVNPAKAIGEVARDAGVPFLLDACQSVGQLPLDVEELGCDFLSATGRKFLRAPRGTGFLYVREGALDSLDPWVIEIRSARWTSAREYELVDGAQRFETWECSYANQLGLGAAARYAMDVGLEAIGERATVLGDRLRTGLAEIDGVRTHDAGAQRCAIVTFTVEGHGADAVAAALAAADINVSTTVPEHGVWVSEARGLPAMVRASPHYLTTDEELDALLEVVERL